MNPFLKILFISSFLVLYFIVIIILKPFQFHLKRKYSTATLKITFLVYFAIFLIFTYFFIFYNGTAIFYLEDPDDPRAMLHFGMLLLSFFIPNTGILIRRNIKNRTIYNSVMSGINILFIFYLLFLIRMVI
jgi:hypothetical protein